MVSKIGLAVTIIAAMLVQNLLFLALLSFGADGWPAHAARHFFFVRPNSAEAASADEVRALDLRDDTGNEAALDRNGAKVPYCSVAGCDPSGSHLLAHAYLKTVTEGVRDAQTVGAAFDFVNKKGRLSRWHQGFHFTNSTTNLPPPSAPSFIVTGTDFAAKIYHNRKADCVSSSIGHGPSGTGSAIVDGTCLWDYIGHGLNSGGTGLAVSTRSMAGGGSQWGLVTDSVVDRNFGDGEIVGQEFDCSNNNRDSYAGGSFGFTCLYMGGNNTEPSLAGIYIDNSAQAIPNGFGYHYGLYVSGQPHTPGSVVEDGAVVDASNARYSIWGLGGRSHAAFIQDESDSLDILVGKNAHKGVGIDLSDASFASRIAFKASADILLTAGLLRPAKYEVLQAPTCDERSAGALVVLTDIAGTPSYHDTHLSGGGTSVALALCNGVAWQLQ